MSEKTNKKKQPTKAEIQAKAASFIDKLEKVSRNEIKLVTKKDTLKDKLDIIKDGLISLKDKKIPFTTIAKLIEDDLGLKVSPQTLRAYCQNHLGFKRNERNKDTSKGEVNNKTENNKVNKKGIFKEKSQTQPQDSYSSASDLASDDENFN